MKLFCRKCRILFASPKYYTIENSKQHSKKINDLKKTYHRGRSIFRKFFDCIKANFGPRAGWI